MRGLLADVNVQGHLTYILHLLESLVLMVLLDEIGLRLVTFRDLGLDRGLGDRPLWEFCQRQEWVLFTADRNDDGPDSLQRTLDDSWFDGCLPVLTLSNKGRFEQNRVYEDRVAEDIATLMFGIESEGQYRDRPRIYVPLRWP
jgi:hypothetical protein